MPFSLSREDVAGYVLHDSHVKDILMKEFSITYYLLHLILIFFKVKDMVLPPFEIGDVKDSILDLDQVTIDQFSCEYQVIEQKSYTLTYFSC